MTRIFWDAMLFIYLLQDDPVFGERVRYLRKRSLERGDVIYTSSLVIGEVLAGVYRDKTPDDALRVKTGILAAGVKVLPFDLVASEAFASIRSTHRTSASDSIHLACAAAAGIDLFITGDKQLMKLNVPGIKFIDSINTQLM